MYILCTNATFYVRSFLKIIQVPTFRTFLVVVHFETNPFRSRRETDFGRSHPLMSISHGTYCRHQETFYGYMKRASAFLAGVVEDQAQDSLPVVRSSLFSTVLRGGRESSSRCPLEAVRLSIPPDLGLSHLWPSRSRACDGVHERQLPHPSPPLECVEFKQDS